VSMRVRKLSCSVALATLILIAPCAAQQLGNDALSVRVNAKEGTFQVRSGKAGLCLPAVWLHKSITIGCVRAIIRVTLRPNLSLRNHAVALAHSRLQQTL
jgi:hypothetical protein